MKYLLVLVVVWVAFMIWRANRQGESRAAPPPPSAPPAVPPPQAMLRCAHCGVHLPAADALSSPSGKMYCSAAHRQADQ